MGVREAAVRVLKEAGTPLHTREITERILDQGLWNTKGKTPAATVEARLSSDIKHRGDHSAFVRVAPSTYTLAEFRDEPSRRQQDTEPAGETYSFTAAAEKILERFGDKRPMHYRDITDKALELNWLNTEGKTPEATMYAQILSEIKRCAQMPFRWLS